MFDNLFDQETVTRNEILRHRREATEIVEKKAEEAAKIADKKAQELTAQKVAEAKALKDVQYTTNMLKAGVSDENILAWSGISKPELEDLKKKLDKEQQDQLS